jgi:hypothetical protein
LALFLWTTAWLLLTLALASTAALARVLAPPVRSLLNNLVQPAAQIMRNEERAFREARSFLCIICLFLRIFPYSSREIRSIRPDFCHFLTHHSQIFETCAKSIA